MLRLQLVEALMLHVTPFIVSYRMNMGHTPQQAIKCLRPEVRPNTQKENVD